jgi:hypothetical protein
MEEAAGYGGSAAVRKSQKAGDEGEGDAQEAKCGVPLHPHGKIVTLCPGTATEPPKDVRV